jgi:tetratricopeptide (TPR) repeat protein
MKRVKFAACLILAGLLLGGLFLFWPRRADSLLHRGAAAYGRGDWSGASDLARHRLRIAPDDSEALRLLARATARLGRDAPANALFARLGKDSLRAEDYFLLGLGLYRAGRSDSAVGLWEKALADDPDHGETLAQLALAYTSRNRLIEAARLYERLAKLPGWELRGELSLGGLRAELDDPAGASSVLRGCEKFVICTLGPPILTRRSDNATRVSANCVQKF